MLIELMMARAALERIETDTAMFRRRDAIATASPPSLASRLQGWIEAVVAKPPAVRQTTSRPRPSELEH